MCVCVCVCARVYTSYVASCAYFCVRARVDVSVYICVYPCEEKRKGIIFSFAQGPVRACVCVCVFVWACVYVGDWAFEGESRLIGVIMRTNAELYCNQDAYDTVSKRDKQYGENLHCISYLYFFRRLFNVIAALGDTEEGSEKEDDA